MALRKLNEILFTNCLEEDVTDVVVLYCESNKSINNWYNLKEVDVETSKNILWSRHVAFQTITSSTSSIIPAEQICFGENDGYWQLYFTFRGENYKLEKNNCKMTLSSNCDQQDLKIQLLSSVIMNGNGKCHEHLKVNFQVSSVNAEFKIVQGRPVVRGVEVRIHNHLKKDIGVTSAKFYENHSQSNLTQPHFINVHFDKNVINPEGVMASLERLPYKCFGYKHYLKFCFTYECICYEIDAKNSQGIPIDLGEKDYGNSLNISICKHMPNSEILVKIKTNDEMKNLTASAKGSIDSKKTRIVEEALRIKQSHMLEISVIEFMHSLRKLSSKAYDEDIVNKAIILDGDENSKFVHPSLFPKLPFDEVDIYGEKLRVKSNLSNSNKIEQLLKNIIIDLYSLKCEWDALNKLFISLNDLLETVDASQDDELCRISEDLKMIHSMHMIDVLCRILIPTGLDEIGLTFYTSKSEIAREVTINPGRLASAIEDEFSLWKASAFSQDAGISIYLSKESEDSALAVRNLKIYQNILFNLAELFVLIRLELIDSLRNVASALHSQNRNVNISMVSSSSIGVVGAGFIVAGLVLAPITAGLSLPLVATGIGVGVVSGVIGIGTATANGILTTKFLDSTVTLAMNDHYIGSLLSKLKPVLIKQINLLQNYQKDLNYSETDDNSYFKIKTVAGSTGSAISNAGVAILKTGVQVVKIAAFRIGSVVIGAVFDLSTLAVNAVRLSKKEGSELGYKLEMDALLLEQELDENGFAFIKNSTPKEKKKSEFICAFLRDYL